MWQQRVHTIVANRRRQDRALTMDDALADADRPHNRSWRALQLRAAAPALPAPLALSGDLPEFEMTSKERRAYRRNAR